MRTILLDLDDTLVPDHSDFLAAVDDTAAAAGAPAGMSAAVRVRARERWREAAEDTRIRMTDISSWESLWAPFPADLRPWADGYRLGVWREALRDCGVDEAGLAQRLAESYRERRLERCSPYPEVVGVLEDLRGIARLGVVTNGMEEHQRAKLDAAGLTGLFDVLVSSAVVGASKPDPRIFQFALERVGSRAADAVMVGDNPTRDIAGAQQAGIRGVWVDRNGGDNCGVIPDARVSDLGGLAGLGWW